MANVLIISKNDPVEAIEKKVKDWSDAVSAGAKKFDAVKYTGRIKSYGNGLDYQRKLRDEWD